MVQEGSVCRRERHNDKKGGMVIVCVKGGWGGGLGAAGSRGGQLHIGGGQGRLSCACGVDCVEDNGARQ